MALNLGCHFLTIKETSPTVRMIFWFPSRAGAQTAWDMLHEEEMFPRITTSCMDLDNILGGGINCKEVTEIG